MIAFSEIGVVDYEVYARREAEIFYSQNTIEVFLESDLSRLEEVISKILRKKKGTVSNVINNKP